MNWNQRTVPWNGVGVDIKDCRDVESALKVSQLDWDVETHDIMDSYGDTIPGYQEVMRMDNHQALGIVLQSRIKMLFLL